MSAFIWVISMALVFVCGGIFAQKYSSEEMGPRKFSEEQLFRRDVMQFLQNGLDSGELPSPHQMHESAGFSGKFQLNHRLMRNQATCTHFKVEKRITLDGKKFRPEIIDEIYCVNTGDTSAEYCSMGNMRCKQKREKFYIGWKIEGGNSCYSEPYYYYRPAGCECYEIS